MKTTSFNRKGEPITVFIPSKEKFTVGQTNWVVEELNAVVLPMTFENKDGVKSADLYHSRNSAPVLVGHGTCAPVDGEFVETVNIVFC